MVETRKKRILLIGEASYLSTGFATLGLELLKHLHATGKYELAELASFGDPLDPRSHETPWKFYPVMPRRDREDEVRAYNANPENKFGAWKFEETLIDFKPDVCVDARDHWYLSFEERSPLRRYFHYAIMPTVDAEPQRDEWISTYINADAVFTYSDWALDLLNEQGGGKIKTVCAAPPGADIGTYFIRKDKRQHRIEKSLDPDALIVGTVMRNQKRKLYPDLLEAFALFLKQAPAELAKKTFLYIHANVVDVGWEIQKYLHEFGVAHKTLFTYLCKSCGSVFPAFFQDARAHCRHCHQPTATMPDTNLGVPTSVLSEIFALMDCYVQFSTSEGFAIPIVEAAACGIPVFCTNYSAMEDFPRTIGAIPIEVERLVYESETGCKRAMPSNSDLAGKLIDFLSLPEPMRQRIGYAARQGIEKHYTWQRTGKIWEDHFDSLPLNEAWATPPQIHRIPAFPAHSSGVTNEDFVKWCFVNVAGRPEMIQSFLYQKILRDLNWESTLNSVSSYFSEESLLGSEKRFVQFDRGSVYEIAKRLGEEKNWWEGRR